jgi:hypothetical protein
VSSSPPLELRTTAALMREASRRDKTMHRGGEWAFECSCANRTSGVSSRLGGGRGDVPKRDPDAVNLVVLAELVVPTPFIGAVRDDEGIDVISDVDE